MKKRLATLGLIGLLALAAVGCGGSGDQTFSADGYPFEFDYPSSWTLTQGSNFQYGGSGAALRSVSVALKDPFDQVTVTQYKLKKKLPKGENAYRPEVDRIVARMARQAGGSVSDARKVTYGGVPGYQYVIKFEAGDAKLESRLTLLFNGVDEFQISCQSTEENRPELNDGCDQMLESFKFD